MNVEEGLMGMDENRFRGIVANCLGIPMETDFWLSSGTRPLTTQNIVKLTEGNTVWCNMRLRGGIDFQNRAGVKFGKRMTSESQDAVQRQERLRQLALETMDITKDPYFMRNNTGGCECRLCMTAHKTEANYMAHTQAKRHQENLRKRAKMEEDKQRRAEAATQRREAVTKRKIVRIGKPGYRITKVRDIKTGNRCLTFSVEYPEGQEGIQPRHRFMSAFEQKVEPADKRYQYIVLSCDPYENVAFKIPAWTVDKEEGRMWSAWDADAKVFTLEVNLLNPIYLDALAEARVRAAAEESAARAEAVRRAWEAKEAAERDGV